MIFTELVLQNFGPYLGHHIINLRPDSKEITRPIILFGAMNGGGKTTLMDAIRLALYGQRAQCSTRHNLSYSDFLTQSVNQQAPPDEQTRIELAFEHIVDSQWREYRIVRHWTKDPKEGKDTLGILDENWPDSALANTWDEYIETILPLGISNLFLFDGEQVKELAEQDAPPSSVIEAIQALLGLELAGRLAIDLDVLVSRKRKTLVTTSQLTTLEEIEAQLTQYIQTAETAKETLDSLQKQLKLSQQNYEEASHKFRIEGGKIAAEKSQLEMRHKELTTAAENQREGLRNLAADILPLQLIFFPLLEQAKQQAEQEIKIQQLTIAKAVLEKRDQKLLDYLSQLALSLEQLQQIQAFLITENQNLNPEMSSQPFLIVNEDILKNIEQILNQLPLQVTLAKQYCDRLHDLEIQLDNTERELAVAASPEDYEKLNEVLTITHKEFLQCQAAYTEKIRKYEDAKKAIEKTKKELENYSEEALKRQNDEHILKSAAKVQKTLQLFKERLTLKKLNKLEGEVTECFRYLLHKSDLVHRVAIDTQNFSLSLYNPQGQPVPKKRLSAGEKQLLAIAFLWGLARVSGRNLPVAIDTPLGRLDSSHRHHLVERYFPTASHQVILLSTDTEIGEKEIKLLREQDVIAREFLLKYDAEKRQTIVHPDTYFF